MSRPLIKVFQVIIMYNAFSRYNVYEIYMLLRK